MIQSAHGRAGLAGEDLPHPGIARGFWSSGVGVALVLLSRERTFAWGRRWLAALFVLYVALSMPLVVRLAAPRAWRARVQSRTRAEARDAATIVLLGQRRRSPSARWRPPSICRASTRRSTSAKPPGSIGCWDGRRIIASGGIPRGRRRPPAGERGHARLPGAPRRPRRRHRARVDVDQHHRAGPARRGARFPPDRRVLLVTAPAHLPRAAALFRGRGLDVVPAVSASLPDQRRHLGRSACCRTALRCEPAKSPATSGSRLPSTGSEATSPVV